MFEIIRATNTRVIQYLEPMLLPDDEVPKEVYIEELRAAMIQQPEDLLVLVAHEQDKIIGFLIGFAPKNVNYCFVSQLWVEQNQPRQVASALGVRMHSWTFDMIGRPAVRAITTRAPEAFQRRFGYRPVSTIIELREEWTSEQVPTEGSQWSDKPTEGSEQSVLPATQPESGQNGDSVHGSTESGDGERIRQDQRSDAEIRPISGLPPKGD